MEGLNKIINDLEYAAFNLCNGKKDTDLPIGIIESTGADDSLLIAIRELKELANRHEPRVIKKNAGIERLKNDCMKAQSKYEECWEDQPFDEDDEKFTCKRCGGFLYIEQGGDTVDCTHCNGTGIQKPERKFNAQKFGEWAEAEPFFYFNEDEEETKEWDDESIFSL